MTLDSLIAPLVKAAQTAPSGDNCQPFTFEWDGRTLAVKHHEDRGRAFLNPHNAASLLTLGMTLELLSIKASEFGLRAQTRLTPDLGSDLRPAWAEVRFEPDAAITKDHLVDSIFERFTDRRPFAGGSITPRESEALLQENRGYDPRVSCRIVTRPFDPLFQNIKDNEDYVWSHVQPVKELLQKVIFNRVRALKIGEGMYWKELGIGILEAVPLWCMKLCSPLIRVLYHLGLKSMAERVAVRNLRSSAGMIYFSTSKPGSESLVCVGRQSLRAWLRLQSMGYSVQPYTQTSLPYYYSCMGWMTNDVKPRFRIHFENSLSFVRSFFGLTETEVPVWCLRFGRPLNKRNHRLGLRRPLDQILDRRDSEYRSRHSFLEAGDRSVI